MSRGRKPLYESSVTRAFTLDEKNDKYLAWRAEQKGHTSVGMTLNKLLAMLRKKAEEDGVFSAKKAKKAKPTVQKAVKVTKPSKKTAKRGPGRPAGSKNKSSPVKVTVKKTAKKVSKVKGKKK